MKFNLTFFIVEQFEWLKKNFTSSEIKVKEHVIVFALQQDQKVFFSFSTVQRLNLLLAKYQHGDETQPSVRNWRVT